MLRQLLVSCNERGVTKCTQTTMSYVRDRSALVMDALCAARDKESNGRGGMGTGGRQSGMACRFFWSAWQIGNTRIMFIACRQKTASKLSCATLSPVSNVMPVCLQYPPLSLCCPTTLFPLLPLTLISKWFAGA